MAFDNHRVVAAARPASALAPRIVVHIDIFEAQRPDRRDLRDVISSSAPMEVRGIARQDNHAAGRIGLHLVAVELIA